MSGARDLACYSVRLRIRADSTISWTSAGIDQRGPGTYVITPIISATSSEHAIERAIELGQMIRGQAAVRARLTIDVLSVSQKCPPGRHVPGGGEHPGEG